MWYELFIITSSGLGVAIFLIYLLASRIPTQEDLLAVGMAVVDAKLKEFGLDDTSSSGGGRKAEGWAGMLERFIVTPVGQEIAKKFAGTLTGGMNYGP